MGTIAVKTNKLSKEFGQLKAVSEVSLEIPTGIVFGFLGPNGSGKTTTIRMLLGLMDPTAGSANVLGYDIKTQASLIRENCGALLENTGLYERLSAEENLEFYGRVWHMSAADRQARIKELLGSVDLWDRRKETVGTWSRGMKQKLAIARALFHRPSLLILDEPTSGLDPVSAVALREDLHKLVKEEGITVFLNTHNLAEAEKLCDQVAVIQNGKLMAQGAPDSLGMQKDRTTIRVSGSGFTLQVVEKLKEMENVLDARLSNGYLYIDAKGDARTAPYVQSLVNLGVEVEEVKKEQASLEEVFLKLVEEEHVS